MLFRNFDLTGVEKQDRHWEVPFASIVGFQRDDALIKLATAAEVWEIVPRYDHYAHILTGLAMGRAGRLATIVDAPPPTPAAPSASEEVMRLLAQLAEFKEKGILSAEEFEQKKKELLARL